MGFLVSFSGWFHASLWHWMGRLGSVAAASTSLVLAVFGHVHLFLVFVAWIVSNLLLMAYAWKFRLHPIFWLEMVYIGINVIGAFRHWHG